MNLSAPRRPVVPAMLYGLCLIGAGAACAPETGDEPSVVVPQPLDTTPPDSLTDGPTDAADEDAAPADSSAPDVGPDARPDAAAPDLAPPDAGPAPDAGPDRGPRALIHIEVPETTVGEPVDFELPGGMQALLVQARGAADGVYGVHAVEGPDGPLVEPETSRVALGPEVAVALLPNTGQIAALPAGRYTVTFASAGPDARPLQPGIYAVDGPGGRLDVTLHLPPSVRAPDDPAVEAMARALEAQLDIAFGFDARVEPRALPAGSPDTLLINGAALDFAALVDLGRAAGDAAGAGVDLFLVDRIADGANGLTGFSGGLPAPLGLPGNAAGVVAVPQALIDDFPDAVADRAVHEIGHALGLYHTTGPFGRVDPIDDTPTCPQACDGDGDGVLFARECGARGRGDAPCRGAADNLMFWTLGGDRSVTPGQRAVVRRHPLVE